MATVNFIRYARQSARALGSVLQYVTQKDKIWDESSGQCLVSGQNCSPQFSFREFQATRSVWHKDSPVWFYHYTQSFHPDEPVDGPTAHELARAFAAQAWPDSEVLIATHIDADHTHSHFIVNAVCHRTGRMLRQGPGTLNRLRQLSDQLCRTHGLSVLPPQGQEGHGMTGREYRSAAKGKSWKFQTMNAIDQCMRHSATKEEFIRKMERLGYQVRWEAGRKNITYTHPSGKKVRDRKLHEEKYWKERMEREFELRQQAIYGGIETTQPAPGGRGRERAEVGASPRPGGLVRASGSAQCAVPPDSGAVRLAQEPQARSINGADTAGQGYRSDSSDAGTGAERTGWEEERAAFFASLAQHRSAAPVPGLAASTAGTARTVGAVVQLGRTLEHDQPPVYVTHPHHDQKALRREQEKKIALGHKPDDHEEMQGPSLSL